MRFGQIPLMDSKWKDRPLSNLVKWMMVQGDIDANRVSEYLGISRNYFDNKMHRNSFSVYDILKISEICNCLIEFTSLRRDYYDEEIDDFW